MAEYTGRTSNGVRYIIDTRYAAEPGTPEYERICAEQCRVAHRILVHAAQRNGTNERGKDGRKNDAEFGAHASGNH